MFKKYGLLNVLETAVRTGEYLPLNRFKAIINQRISSKEHNAFSVTCMLFKGVQLFTRCISDIKMWSWWVFAHRHPQHSYKVRVLCRLLVGQHCLKQVVFHYNRSSPVCDLCEMYVAETAPHLLFECVYFSKSRQKLWQDVLDNAPCAMNLALNHMNSMEKSVFILSGFNCKYVPEWSLLYSAALNFCYYMYIERRSCDVPCYTIDGWFLHILSKLVMCDTCQ